MFGRCKKCGYQAGIFNLRNGICKQCYFKNNVYNQEDEDILIDQLLGLSQPRLHHYTFAQQAIPGIAQSNPDNFFTGFGVNPKNNLESIWNKVCEISNETEITDLCADDFHVSTMMLYESRAVLIKMPPPMTQTEAYAIVIIEDHTGNDIKARCITFEQSDDQDNCFICEISEEGIHLNLDNIPTKVLTESNIYFSIAYGIIFEITSN